MGVPVLRRWLQVGAAATVFAVPAAMVGVPFGMAWQAALSVFVLASLVWAIPQKRPSRGLLRGAIIGALAHFPCWGLTAALEGRAGLDKLSLMEALATALTFSATMGAVSLLLLGWLTVGLGAGLGLVVNLFVMEPALSRPSASSPR